MGGVAIFSGLILPKALHLHLLHQDPEVSKLAPWYQGWGDSSSSLPSSLPSRDLFICSVKQWRAESQSVANPNPELPKAWEPLWYINLWHVFGIVTNPKKQTEPSSEVTTWRTCSQSKPSTPAWGWSWCSREVPLDWCCSVPYAAMPALSSLTWPKRLYWDILLRGTSGHREPPFPCYLVECH